MFIFDYFHQNKSLLFPNELHKHLLDLPTRFHQMHFSPKFSRQYAQ